MISWSLLLSAPGHAYHKGWHRLGRFFKALSIGVEEPFIYGGINLTTLTAKDFAADPYSSDDAEFRGAGFNIGGGVAFYLTPQFALTGTVLYRYVKMEDLDAAGVSGEIDHSLNASDVNFMLGTSFTF